MRYYFFIKRKRILICSFVFTIALLSSKCTFDNVYINREKDVVDGQKMIDRLYGEISKTTFSNVEGMVSDSMKSIGNGRSSIVELLKFVNMKAGNYKRHQIVDRYVKCVTGIVNETTYNYKLKVFYDKGIIDEIVGFQKKDNSSIKLFSYHVNSDILTH